MKTTSPGTCRSVSRFGLFYLAACLPFCVAAPVRNCSAAILHFQFAGEAETGLDNFVSPGTPVSGSFSINTIGTVQNNSSEDGMVYPVDAMILHTGSLTMAATTQFAGSLTIAHGHPGFNDRYYLTMKFDVAVGPDSFYSPLPDGAQGGAAVLGIAGLERGTLADITDIGNALAQIRGVLINFGPGDYDFPGGSVHLPPVDIGSAQLASFHAVQVPEPATFVLALVGLAIAAAHHARRRGG